MLWKQPGRETNNTFFGRRGESGPKQIINIDERFYWIWYIGSKNNWTKTQIEMFYLIL